MKTEAIFPIKSIAWTMGFALFVSLAGHSAAQSQRRGDSQSIDLGDATWMPLDILHYGQGSLFQGNFALDIPFGPSTEVKEFSTPTSVPYSWRIPRFADTDSVARSDETGTAQSSDYAASAHNLSFGDFGTTSRISGVGGIESIGNRSPTSVVSTGRSSAVLSSITPGKASTPATAGDNPVELSGDITLQFSRILDNQGNTTGYTYTGAPSVNLTLNVPIIAIPIGINSSYRDGQPHNWSNVLLWDNPTLNIANGVSLYASVTGDGSGVPSLGGVINAVDTLQSLGPTEKSIPTPINITSPDIAGFNVSFGVNATLQFDVTLASGSNIVLDQTAVLQQFTIESGAIFTGSNNLTVRTDFVNHGYATNLGGTIQGNFINDSGPDQGASVGGTLTIQGDLENSGSLTISSGGTLNLQTFTTNTGTVTVNGGTINIQGGLVNDETIDVLAGTVQGDHLSNRGTFQLGGGILSFSLGLSTSGTFEWSGGGISGSGGLTNTGNAFTIDGTAGKTIYGGAVLTNTGTITQLAGGVTFFGSGNSNAVLNNQAGALYDIQSDGTVLSTTFIYGNGYTSGTINNAGTFQKSAGSGTSVIGTVFNNTGTVGVSSGTLSFQGSGSSTGGSYVFANGGQAQLGGGNFNFSGVNTLSGSGTLGVVNGTTVVAANGVTATLSNSASGANLVIGGGYLYGDTGGTFNLNLTGGSEVQLTGGGIGGAGITTNQGTFEWSGGGISGSGGLTNTGNAFTIDGTAGKTIYGGAVLTNTGTITQLAGGVTFFGSGNSNAVLNNQAGALYDIQSDGTVLSTTFIYGNGYTSGTINNAGTFQKSAGSGTSVIGTVFNNTGTVGVSSGTLSFQGSGSSTGGSYVFANGGQAQLGGGNFNFSGVNTLSGSGTLGVVNGTTVVAANGVTATLSNSASGANLVIGGGYLYGDTGGTFNLNLTGGSEVQLTGGGIGGAGITTNQGTFEWSGGGISGSGGLTNTGNAFTIDGTAGKTIYGGAVLTNTGTITQLAGGVTFFGSGNSNAVLNNQAGALYDIQSDGTVLSTTFIYGNGYTSGTINNAGTFQKSAGSGTSVIGTVFNNTGTVGVSSGTLSFQSGVNQQVGDTLTGGNWVVSGNSTLTFAGGGNITTNQANITLNGSNASFTNIAGLKNNQGTFNVLGGQNFGTTSDLANSGQVNIGRGSTLTVSGMLTQTAGGTLAGQGTLVGNAALNGTLLNATPGVLTLRGSLTLEPNTILSYGLGNPDRIAGDNRVDIFPSNPANILSSGNLVLDGTLHVSDLGAFAPGTYVLFTYTGTLTDDGLNIAPLPDGFSGSILTGPGFVDLVVVPEPAETWMFGIAVALSALCHRFWAIKRRN